jgi:hypothetical protein
MVAAEPDPVNLVDLLLNPPNAFLDEKQPWLLASIGKKDIYLSANLLSIKL